MFTILFRTPQSAPSRRRLVLGSVGALLLAVLIVVHAVAITLFLWSATAPPKVLAMLAFLWVLSFVGLFLLFRFVRHSVALWNGSAIEPHPRG